jgi:addiction module RelE/StbE family toxin
MWTIAEERDVQKSIAKHAVPANIVKRYEAWKAIVRSSGPNALRVLPGLRDHTLQGAWKGFRASYLNETWRVIYRIENEVVQVVVVRISAHDYRR